MAWILTKESQHETISEIAKSSPRAAAIVAAAFLDERLTAAIHSRLLPLSKEIKNRMFGDHGMRTAAKVDLGFALGLYGQEALDDLTTIRKIRNTFAHKEEIRDFEHSEIDKLCKGLRL
jgi:hypothetical protein